MSTVESITDAIAKLPPDGLARVRAWLAEQAADEWDAKIEADARAGRLAALTAKALAEHRAGWTAAVRK